MLDASGDSVAAEKAIPAEILERLALGCGPTSSEVCLAGSGCLVRVTMVRMSRPCADQAPESPIPTSTKSWEDCVAGCPKLENSAKTNRQFSRNLFDMNLAGAET